MSWRKSTINDRATTVAVIPTAVISVKAVIQWLRSARCAT